MRYDQTGKFSKASPQHWLPVEIHAARRIPQVTSQPSYGQWLIEWMIQPLKMLIFHGYVRLLEGTYYLLG